jgi:hypothetical protein
MAVFCHRKPGMGHSGEDIIENDSSTTPEERGQAKQEEKKQKAKSQKLIAKR